MHGFGPKLTVLAMIINARGVVSIFAKRRAVLRLVRTVHAEPDDEWQLDRRYFSTEAPAPSAIAPAQSTSACAADSVEMKAPGASCRPSSRCSTARPRTPMR